jgi:hypothetical protein
LFEDTFERGQMRGRCHTDREGDTVRDEMNEKKEKDRERM